jgi:hypothetical protein
VLKRHVVPLSRRVALDPWALAHDSRSFFATVYSPAFSGVARIDVPTSRITEIRAFPDPAAEQADGAFDGRWLVWAEYRGFESFDDFTVWAWDSRTGGVRQIGAATRAPDGRLWPSPWRQPDVREGIATWTQGSGPDELTDVHLYDLRTGEDRVVHSGHAQGSFLLRKDLVACVGDTQTRRYVQITAHGGWTRVDASSLLVLYATGSKELDARAPIAFVRLRDLPPIPACS